MSLPQVANGLSLAQEIALLLQLAQDVRALEWFSTACITLTTWDTIINFPRELKYMWRGPLSTGKILYFILRYAAPAYEIIIFVVYSHVKTTVPTCEGIAYYAVWFAPIIQIPSMTVQILRLYAIWSKKRSVLIISVTAGVLAMAAYLTAAGMETAIEHGNFSDNIVSEAFGCRFSAIPPDQAKLHKVIVAEWVAPVVFETVIFTMLLPRYITYKWKPRDVLSVLLRDGFVYYLIMLVNGIGNAILTFFVPEARQALLLVLLPWQMSTQSIVMSYMLLNVKEAADDLLLKPGSSPSNDFLTVNLSSDMSSSAPSHSRPQSHHVHYVINISPGHGRTTTSEEHELQESSVEYSSHKPSADMSFA